MVSLNHICTTQQVAVDRHMMSPCVGITRSATRCSKPAAASAPARPANRKGQPRLLCQVQSRRSCPAAPAAPDASDAAAAAAAAAVLKSALEAAPAAPAAADGGWRGCGARRSAWGRCCKRGRSHSRGAHGGENATSGRILRPGGAAAAKEGSRVIGGRLGGRSQPLRSCSGSTAGTARHFDPCHVIIQTGG